MEAKLASLKMEAQEHEGTIATEMAEESKA